MTYRLALAITVAGNIGANVAFKNFVETSQFPLAFGKPDNWR